MPLKSVRAFIILAAVAASLLMAGRSNAEAARRLAFVVGNSAYSSAIPLPNASNDAAAFADLLQRNGFEVERLVDVTRADFAEGLARFAKRIEAGDTALFYFAGHGVQLRGENFLLGLDARLESEFAVEGEAIALDSIITLMERKAAVSIVFVDACRNNPLADRLNREIHGVTRGATAQGLAPVEAVGKDTMVAFAATPGQVAYDGEAGNSPFTTALLKHLATPSLEIGAAFKRVVRDVRERTGNQQSPQLVSNLATEIYINPRLSISSADEPLKPALDIQSTDEPGEGAAAQESERPQPPGNQELALELALWTLVIDSNEPRALESYLERFPSGTFAELARERLRGVFAEPLEPGTQPPPDGSPDDKGLVVRLQRELARVGCSPGAVDGIWGRRTQAAFETFAGMAGLSLATRRPEPAMLDELGRFTTRVCPLTCSARQQVVDGRCVQKTCSAGKQLNSRGNCITPTRQAASSPRPERKVTCRLETRDECRARGRAAGAVRGTGFCQSSNRRQICE